MTFRHFRWHRLRQTACLIILAGVLCLSPVSQLSAASFLPKYEGECTGGHYFTMVDSDGRPIMYSGNVLYPGDEYITAANALYRVTSVRGYKAYARLIGKENLAADTPLAMPPVWGALNSTAAQSRVVAIYHTHSDESYVPTDGRASIYGHGGIFKVGDAFTQSLNSLGIKVAHSLRPHDPHDVNAYYRSRRTAVQLLRQQPMALIDVHRDAVPPNVYSAKYKGDQITRVKLVVGRANPRMSTNLAFAKRIKEVVDQKTPNVIEGILLAKGDYNQDLSPRAILMEVGAHTNSRIAAEEGIAILARSLPEVLGINGKSTPLPKADSGESRGAWRSVWWLLLLVGLGLAAFLYINEGSWSGAGERLRNIWQRIRSGGRR